MMHLDFDGLPEKAFIENRFKITTKEGVPNLIFVTRGESGFCPVFTPLTAEEANRKVLGIEVTAGQAEAMIFGSMFGWEIRQEHLVGVIKEGNPK